MPQQYAEDGASARQWQQIARYVAVAHGVNMHFEGALTQKQACDQRLDCNVGSENPPVQGWLFFREELNSDTLTYQHLFWLSDMRWQFD